MAKTSEATLKAINKYKQKLDEVRFNVALGKKEELKQIATAKGYSSLQAYLKAVVAADSGLEL